MSANAIRSKTALPPLSAQDFRLFNTCSEVMNYHHTRFRNYWNDLWTAATTGKKPRGMTNKQLIQTGLDFTRFLTGHHNIEEQYLFPQLAAKMPEFKSDSGKMCKDHKIIHAGLEGLGKYLQGLKSDQFEPDGLKSHMESWGSTLWTHLDEEVAALKAENMQKYWSKEEMQEIVRRWT